MKADSAESKSNRIFESIRTAILSGQLKPGDRLLNERELAKKFEVGRPLLREAIRSLSMLGVLEVRQGDGTYVRRVRVEDFSPYFTFALAQNVEDWRDVLQIRMAIELQAVKLACSRANQSDIENIERCLEKIKHTAFDNEDGALADFYFHQATVYASHSQSLITIYNSISDIVKKHHIERRKDIEIDENMIDSLIDVHANICTAIIAKNEALAYSNLMEHYEYTEKIATERKLKKISGTRSISR